MTTYKNIHGKRVKTFATDLDNAEAEGQIFFSEAAIGREFKTVVSSAAWHSTGSLLSDRGFLSSSGTQTASWVAGGFDTESPPNYFSATEEYNGSGWTSGGNLPAALYGAGAAGTQTAGLIFGGANSSDTKQSATATYNGSSWSATPNSMNTGRDQIVGGGVQTSALAVGGRTSAAMLTNMEEWNGTSWSNLTAMSQARGYAQANGPETAFFIAGGATGDNGGGPMTNLTEEYDGSSLSSGANINTARSAGGAAGDSSAGLIWGGWTGASPGLALNCETYDGTSWTETADLANHKRGTGSGAGTSNTAAIAAGSYGPPSSTTSEEFNVTVNTITAAAWASGGALPAVNNGLAGAGTQTAALGFGSRTPGQDQATYEYDGSSWSSGGSLGTPIGNGNGAGTQTAGLSFGGGPSGGNSTDSREYNGTSWTAGNSMNNAKALAAGTGTQTAALVSHGTPHPNTVSEEYNGTSWTAGGTVGTARYNVGAGGTSSAAVAFGGFPPSTYNNASEDYDGSSWTAGNSLSNKRGLYNGGDGANTNYVYATGGDASGAPLGSDTNAVEIYNGTNWSTAPNLSNGRRSGASGVAGSSSLSIFFGGRTGGSDQNKTEEFTGETTALNLKTITDS